MGIGAVSQRNHLASETCEMLPASMVHEEDGGDEAPGLDAMLRLSFIELEEQLQ